MGFTTPAVLLAGILSWALTAQDPPAGGDEAVLDRVEMKNGDVLKGTVTSMKGGVLILSTDYSKELAIDLSRVKSMVTGRAITVALENGDRVKGRLRTNDDGTFVVESGVEGDATTARWERLVAINPPEKPPARYRGSVTFGATVQSGNVDRTTAALSAQAERKTEIDRTSFRFLWNYAEESDVRTTRNVYAGLKYDYYFSKRFYGYISGDMQHDEFKDLDLRATGGAGVGYQVVEREDLDVSVEAGLTYVSENREFSPDDDYLAARVAGRANWQITKAVAFGNYSQVWPSLEEDEYLARNEAALTSALGAGWAASIANIVEYDSETPPGIEKADVTWILGLQYSF